MVDRGTNTLLSTVGHTWLQHATQENYDHWYYGSAYSEGLVNKIFYVNSEQPITNYYGEINTLGILNSVWNTVSNLINSNSPVADLARTTLHASVFQTGFHQQSSSSLNLERFSNGEFVYPDTSYNTLDGFSVVAQNQTRKVQIYEKLIFGINSRQLTRLLKVLILIWTATMNTFYIIKTYLQYLNRWVEKFQQCSQEVRAQIRFIRYWVILFLIRVQKQNLKEHQM